MVDESRFSDCMKRQWRHSDTHPDCARLGSLELSERLLFRLMWLLASLRCDIRDLFIPASRALSLPPSSPSDEWWPPVACRVVVGTPRRPTTANVTELEVYIQTSMHAKYIEQARTQTWLLLGFFNVINIDSQSRLLRPAKTLVSALTEWCLDIGIRHDDSLDDALDDAHGRIFRCDLSSSRQRSHVCRCSKANLG